MRCPVCKKEVEPGGSEFPFCSERCRTTDLGNWSAAKYVISLPAEPRPPEGEDADEEE